MRGCARAGEATRDGLAESSVRRFRATPSSFFALAVRERLILANPVLPSRIPRSGGTRVEMYPFTEDELGEVHRAASAREPRLAAIVLVAGWTGVRWSGPRAVRVRDLVGVPRPALVVQGAAPERTPPDRASALVGRGSIGWS